MKEIRRTLTQFINTWLGKKCDFEIRQSVLESEVNEVWLKRYITFINKRIDRTLQEDSVTEKHHIIPKCLFDSYKKANKKSNYITLTAREHWIAHLILYKALPECKSLATSAVLMGITRIDNFNSRKYYSLIKDWKKSASESAKEFNKRRKGNEQYKQNKRTATLKTFENNPELKKQISDKVKELWQDENYRKKMSDSRKKYCNSIEFRTKMSKCQKERFSDKTQREKYSQNMKDIWNNEEYKEMQTDSHKNAWKDPIKRQRMQEGKMKAWDSSLREKQSQITKASLNDPIVKLNHAKGYLKVVMENLKRHPNDKKIIAKRDRWLNEIKQLEEIV